ncbi:energy transducer TonB [uncultured Tenacibaculum sp.]|uniref:energy transducer TonB n=1 Tax=uncultured Tenacibaculum sp. TaxID=174713 RepID=UPI0026377EDB|nr:energy transducer TonB [uncultured Tenacibaculum sp.]
MKSKFFFMLAIAFASQSFSQSNKTCDNPNDEPVLDLNSITKCSIKDSEDKKTKKVSVEVSSRRRVVRKRDAASGVMTNDYTHKLANIKKKANIINTINFNNAGGLKIIPFNYVDEIPLFKECESAPIYKQEKCFKQYISKHIQKHIQYPENSYDRGIQGRVLVQFTIQKDGSVGKMNIVSPYKGEELGKEAERIIKKLPKFIPGKHSGKEVIVKYGVPITFRIPGVRPSNIKKTTKRVIAKEEIYQFADVQEIPKFKSCESATQDCFNKRLVQHIQDHFAYPEQAVRNNIQGKVNISFVINKEGEVVNVKAVGPSDGKVLEMSAKNLVEKLPEFKAAIKDGKKVNTKYSFPISYKLDE